MKAVDYMSFEDTSHRIFSTLGYQHPPARLRARLDYMIEGNHYTKVVYDPQVEQSLPSEYFFMEPHAREPVLAVPERNITTAYDPRDVFSERFHELADGVQGFVECLCKLTSIPRDLVGFYGSWLVGLERSTSDVDLVVYGSVNWRRYLAQYNALLGTYPLLATAHEVARQRAHEYSARLGISVEDVLSVLSRQRTKYLVGDIAVSLAFAWLPGEAPRVRITRAVQKHTVTGEVANDSASSFTPRMYTLNVGRDNYSIITYEYFYKDIVRLGERAKARGTLREGNLLTLDDSGDFILPSPN